MRKHVLLFVHGMGAYVTADGKPDETWFNDSAAALKEQYVKYPIVSLTSFEDRFEIVHINYDTEIFKLVSRWQTESKTILASGIPAAPAEKLVGWLNNAAKIDNNFAWTHAACVILYRFFPLMRQRIKVSVAAQFQQALATNADGPVSAWSVISHSLGTIVTHDVLQAMDSTTPNEAGISILDAMVPSANLLAMVANVSKILETDSPVYDGVVVPQSMVKHSSACYSYLSYRNEFDPFVRLDPFDPGNLPAWSLAKANGSFVDVFTHNIHDLDTHSFRNYIVNPNVHIPLLESLVGLGSITPQQAADARAQFQDVPVATVKTALQDVMARVNPQLAGKADLDAWFELIGLFFAQQTAQPSNAPGGASAAVAAVAATAATGAAAAITAGAKNSTGTPP
jgi:hypothetical protein